MKNIFFSALVVGLLVANGALAQGPICARDNCLRALARRPDTASSWCKENVNYTPTTTTITATEEVCGTTTEYSYSYTRGTHWVYTMTTTTTITSEGFTFAKRDAAETQAIVSKCGSSPAKITSACNCFMGSAPIPVVTTHVTTTTPCEDYTTTTKWHNGTLGVTGTVTTTKTVPPHGSNFPNPDFELSNVEPVHWKVRSELDWIYGKPECGCYCNHDIVQGGHHTGTNDTWPDPLSNAIRIKVEPVFKGNVVTYLTTELTNLDTDIWYQVTFRKKLQIPHYNDTSYEPWTTGYSTMWYGSDWSLDGGGSAAFGFDPATARQWVQQWGGWFRPKQHAMQFRLETNTKLQAWQEEWALYDSFELIWLGP